MSEHDHAKAEDYSGTALGRVDWTKDLARVQGLFRDYRDWLVAHAESSPDKLPGVSRLDADIAGLPGVYGPPGGDVILARVGADVVACGALRGWEGTTAEIKRIYVRADHRGPGFGPILTRALLDRAVALGYERVRVDTLPTMIAAIQFYQDLGFKPVPAYWDHPVPGALFFEWSAAGSRRARD